MADYKEKLGGLASKLKEAGPPTPLQKVSPLKTANVGREVEVQFNNYIPKSLLKQLKTLALELDLSLKELNIKALKAYLKGS
ncbi:hypothetical protein CKK33_01810 [Mucilaginibacter sp. MD40]|uniref:hypothetical protein n=1 Tax=Mucilaginibacter sp. MD40 TaxID=2029590 RepID=UPI000BACBAE5|nr:hypothetical protein [Mucilaginibacter sp. MD40]PAW92294.1 hypothetical protein CKK33_01810 [Mucilaginibacter sp. MD40]